MKTNIFPVYFRELRSLFYSPIAYIVAFTFLLIAGYFWGVMVTQYANFSMMSAARGGQQPMLMLDYLILPFLGNLAVTLLFVMPFIGMRSFSEEKKNGTIETLFTLPLSDVDILLGKYLSGLTLLGLLIGVVGLYPAVFLAPSAQLHWPPILTAYLALFLVGALFLSVSTLASSLTENQVVAAALAFGASLLLFVITWVTQGKSGPAFDALSQLGVMTHFQDMSRGLLNLKDITYFVFFIGFSLFATLRVLESKKWR